MERENNTRTCFSQHWSLLYSGDLSILCILASKHTYVSMVAGWGEKDQWRVKPQKNKWKFDPFYTSDLMDMKIKITHFHVHLHIWPLINKHLFTFSSNWCAVLDYGPILIFFSSMELLRPQMDFSVSCRCTLESSLLELECSSFYLKLINLFPCKRCKTKGFEMFLSSCNVQRLSYDVTFSNYQTNSIRQYKRSEVIHVYGNWY